MKNKISVNSENFLAGYAIKSNDSRGRKFKEQEHPYRSPFQRDRDRIIHSAAFRRLEYKTQVFVNHEGDYYRTRLTHTLEVAQIAKTIACSLGLNEVLAEAIALAHDLGHTPFGHSGEEILNILMRDHGGFNHNYQSLRVVDLLEERYPEFKGLNLTWEVREGIVKHSTSFDIPAICEEFNLEEMPSLEAQVVEIADEVAYDNHDIDDGLTSGLLEVKQLDSVKIWQDAETKTKEKFAKMKPDIQKYQIIRYLINLQVTDLIEESKKNIAKNKIRSLADVRKSKIRIIGFSDRLKEQRLILRDFLLKNLYSHYRVSRMSNKAKRIIQELFNVYLANPEQLPPDYQAKIAKEGSHRVICDYIAGMTDRCAIEEYKKLFDPYEKV
jgi:dGTPase